MDDDRSLALKRRVDFIQPVAALDGEPSRDVLIADSNSLVELLLQGGTTLRRHLHVLDRARP